MVSDRQMALNHRLDLPDDFLELSQAIGDEWFLCQHQGGNTSIKHNHGLTIKASGRSLADSKSNPLNTFISDRDEEIIPGIDKKFSIETPLHRLLRHKHVFHFHPVVVLILSCINKLEVLQKHLSQSIGFPLTMETIPYVNPGMELANELTSRELDCNRDVIVVLESHGIVIASDSVCIAHDIVSKVRQASQSLLHTAIPRFSDIEELSSRLLNDYSTSPFQISMTELGIHETTLKWLMAQDAYLYPDHGVFFKPLGTLFQLDVLASSPDNFGIHLCADRLTIKLPEVSTRSHREHAILIFIIVLSLSKLEQCSFRLLPSSLLDLLISSDAEQYRLANA
jgi:rhamnose utilization protein RhaD (predicted bifunctional aldolase and dehydrogenase)